MPGLTYFYYHRRNHIISSFSHAAFMASAASGWFRHTCTIVHYITLYPLYYYLWSDRISLTNILQYYYFLLSSRVCAFSLCARTPER